jgi:hypothetical protein
MRKLLGLLLRPARSASIHHHYLGMGLGLVVTGTGSALALYADVLHNLTGVPHITLDMLAYGIHGFGLIPTYRHFEHVWDLFDAAEEIAES